jgi:tetratricopeptide (TPR) repeat protein
LSAGGSVASLPAVSKRLAMLEKLAAAGQADAFARYALGMEYRSAGRPDDALNAFAELRRLDPTYVPVYLMAGQVLSEAGKRPEAAEWLRAGVEAARAKGDAHALGELEGLLDQVEGS